MTARNTSTIKRGWSWDSANSQLDLFVNGTEVANFSTTTVNFPNTAATWNFGTSSAPLSYTAGTPCFTLYATSSNTTSTNAEPFYVKSVMTGAGGYGGRSRFHAYTAAALTTNFMGLKSYTEFGAGGSCSGLATGFCSEIVMPNANVAGSYFAIELEYVAGGTSTQASHRGWIYCNSTGDADGDFDDNGVLMYLDGLTAGSGHLYDTTASSATGDATLKISIGGTSKYLLIADDAS